MRSGKRGSFRYTLSLAARVTLTIERPGPGRKSGKACKKQTKRNRKAKKCTFYAPVGKLTHAGKAGAEQRSLLGQARRPGDEARRVPPDRRGRGPQRSQICVRFDASSR